MQPHPRRTEQSGNWREDALRPGSVLFHKGSWLWPMGAIGNTGLYLAQVLSDHHTYRQCPQVKMLTLEIIQWSLVVKASSVSMADWDCSWMLDRNTRCRIGFPCSSKSPAFARADQRSQPCPFTDLHAQPSTACSVPTSIQLLYPFISSVSFLNL